MAGEMKDGGPAFPTSAYGPSGDAIYQPGMSLRDWFATHAPMPRNEDISMMMQLDKARNPYNEAHKPKLRSEYEIVALFKFRYADAMLAQREKDST